MESSGTAPTPAASKQSHSRTYSKLRWRFKKKKKNNSVKRTEATSLPRRAFSEVVRKCTGEISTNSRLSQLRRAQQQRFQPSSCPKKKDVIRAVCFSLRPQTPHRDFSGALTQDKPQPRLFIGAYDRASFQKKKFFFEKCEKCQRFSLLCQTQDTTESVQSEHPVAAAASRLGHLSICVFIRLSGGN